MRFKLLDKMWNFRYSRLRDSNENDGYCDPPKTPNKEIVVASQLRGKRRLEIILHECWHACDWSKDEEFIEESAHDMANVLWRLGYRMVKGEKNNDEVSK